jgi:hypothetical protein
MQISRLGEISLAPLSPKVVGPGEVLVLSGISPLQFLLPTLQAMPRRIIHPNYERFGRIRAHYNLQSALRLAIKVRIMPSYQLSAG